MADINVEDVLSKLTPLEKVSLLADGPNGVRGTKFFNGVPAACFPCGTGLGATWDQDLLEEAGRLMGEECIAKGAHVLLGPTINMQRSPLGGRGFESLSEDPVLAGLGAAALIRGIQSKGVVATIKHFVANDQEHQRQSVDAIVTERALREIYMLPFQLAVRDSKPKAFMTAYNKVNGTHVSENAKIIQTTLRDEWGWRGLVMSDWFGTYSTTEAINAGLDLEMPGPTRFRGEAALHAFLSNKFKPTALDDRAREVLQLVKECAMSGIKEDAPERTLDNPETSALLRRIAAESIVLLKNEGNVLPFRNDKPILVIGPNAKYAAFCGGGSAALAPYYAVTPFDGISAKAKGQKVDFAIGCYSHKELPLVGSSWKTSVDKGSESGLVFRAYNDPPCVTNRECVDEIHITNANMMFMDYKCDGIKTDLWYATIEGYYTAEGDGDYELGDCVYGSARVFVDGKEVIDNATTQRKGSSFFGCGTVEERATVPVKQGQTYHILVDFASAPTNKIIGADTVAFGGGAVRIGGAFKIDEEWEIEHAAALAKEAAQVVVCAGLNMDWETEGSDREHMHLPGHMDRLISAVAAANPKTVVVMQSGTPVEMPWLSSVAGLVQAWYGGNECGNAIADVLFGDVNPSGKLPLSFPVRNEDNPAFLNYRSEGGRTLYGEDVYVGYRYYDTVKRPVNFGFGHGLSYTTFALSKLNVKIDGQNLAVSVDVSNTGERSGAQTVQVYVSQEVPKIRRPVKELKGFTKVLLAKGESKTVDITITLKYAASWFDEHMDKWIMEKGKYKVLVGDSSDLTEGAVQGEFEIEKTTWWTGL
ncbi:beta-glucosidase [Zalaria obscura]|uniref:Beta-glucosidase n=1 Tax=Zalaria obscura TaxID=2024903 RepID=A0ACC3SLE7_9PEZI